MNKYRIHTVHTKEAYMKKKLLSKKNFYLEITAVLILVCPDPLHFHCPENSNESMLQYLRRFEDAARANDHQ